MAKHPTPLRRPMGRPPAADGAATRRTIIDAASRRLASSGFESMTLGDVANELGISRAAIYHYFPSKRELAVAVLRESFDDVDVNYQRLIGPTSTLSDKLRGLVIACMQSSFARQDPVLGWFQMGQLASDDAEVAEIFRNRARGVRRQLRAILAEAVDSGELSDELDQNGIVDAVSGLIWSMTAGAAESSTPATRRQLELAADSLLRAPAWAARPPASRGSGTGRGGG